MPKAKKVDNVAMSGELGSLIGQALGEGIAKGLEGALERVRAELAPLGAEFGTAVVNELVQARAEEAAAHRVCAEGGCDRRAIARGLCRRHYARQIYQERKARSGTPTKTRRRRVTDDEAAATDVATHKKVVAAVAPIVRRRKGEGTDEPPAVTPMPPPAPVSVDAVARFLGVKVD